MTIKTRSEFCDLTGISNAHITMYAKRGKIVLTADRKHLDINHDANARFIQHQAMKGLEAVKKLKFEKETETVKAVTETQTKEAETQKPTAKRKTKAEVKAVKNTDSKWDMELEKLRAEIDKKYIDTDVAKERLNVLRGNNIPIDQVKTIVSMLAHSMITNYKNFQEQHISEICHEFRISETDRAKINKKSVSGLNSIHRKAVSDTNKQVRVSIGTSRSNEESNEESDE